MLEEILDDNGALKEEYWESFSDFMLFWGMDFDYDIEWVYEEDKNFKWWQTKYIESIEFHPHLDPKTYSVFVWFKRGFGGHLSEVDMKTIEKYLRPVILRKKIDRIKKNIG
jgi:hypothetical protein